jgi:lactoylglutathione lyase
MGTLPYDAAAVRFGYAIAYVPDVRAAVEFYERAFGLQRGYVADEGTYGEMATGETKLAFVADAQAEGLFPGGYRHNEAAQQPNGFELALVTDDVDAAYARAVSAGATPLAEPAGKPWGQRIAYVRDPNGILVEIAGATT